jgi:hypothetical protein
MKGNYDAALGRIPVRSYKTASAGALLTLALR